MQYFELSSRFDAEDRSTIEVPAPRGRSIKITGAVPKKSCLWNASVSASAKGVHHRQDTKRVPLKHSSTPSMLLTLQHCITPLRRAPEIPQRIPYQRSKRLSAGTLGKVVQN